jgi:hypothetical protein
MDSIHSVDVYQISIMENKIRFLEKTIESLEEYVTNSQAINSLSERQLEIKDEEIDLIRKELAREKRKKFIVGAASAAIIILLIL